MDEFSLTCADDEGPLECYLFTPQFGLVSMQTIQRPVVLVITHYSTSVTTRGPQCICRLQCASLPGEDTTIQLIPT